MNEQSAKRYVHASPERVRTILLRPLSYPDWNPAFLSMRGPAPVIVGQAYEIRTRGGLAGTFTYTKIEDDLIEATWQVPGLRETGTWHMQATSTGTIVVHEFSQQGVLARALSAAFRGVAELRVGRLAERAESLSERA